MRELVETGGLENLAALTVVCVLTGLRVARWLRLSAIGSGRDIQYHERTIHSTPPDRI
jgi:hypothetical protein